MPQAELVEALRAVSRARNYHHWIFRRIEPYLGRRVLDIGSGLGDFSDFFLRDPGRQTMLSDASEPMVERLRERLGGVPRIETIRLDISNEDHVRHFSKERSPDTITCLNVLEHIEDDAGALQGMRELVAPGGKVILFVPALGCLYGSLDRMAGHYRRYTCKNLTRKLAAAGLNILRMEHFNFFGIFSWFFAGKILCQKQMDPRTCGSLDLLVPGVAWLETVVRPPIGQSILAVAGRPPAGFRSGAQGCADE